MLVQKLRPCGRFHFKETGPEPFCAHCETILLLRFVKDSYRSGVAEWASIFHSIQSHPPAQITQNFNSHPETPETRQTQSA
jgi:hypothetical protein